MNETAYPLSWPLGWRRTPAHKRQRARFSKERVRRVGEQVLRSMESLTVAEAISRLQAELDRLDASTTMLSTNMELRLDGLPRSGQREPEDPGAAVYFTLRMKRTVMACDRWDRVADNIAALAAHIECLRGIDRYGVGSLEQAFRGYQQLEDFTAGVPWRRVFGFKDEEAIDRAKLERRFAELAREHHPDRGGSHEQMAQLNAARQQAREELGG